MAVGYGVVTEGQSTPSEPAWLWDQYVLAVEEYRFQVDLNWRRSQYSFALCAAVLAASFALLNSAAQVPDHLVALAFVASGSISLLAMATTRTQATYYRSARATKAVLEERLGLGEFALRTTPGMKGRLPGLGKVKTFQNAVFGILALLSIAGVFATYGQLGEPRSFGVQPSPAPRLR